MFRSKLLERFKVFSAMQQLIKLVRALTVSRLNIQMKSFDLLSRTNHFYVTIYFQCLERSINTLTLRCKENWAKRYPCMFTLLISAFRMCFARRKHCELACIPNEHKQAPMHNVHTIQCKWNISYLVSFSSFIFFI